MKKKIFVLFMTLILVLNFNANLLVSSPIGYALAVGFELIEN